MKLTLCRARFALVPLVFYIYIYIFRFCFIYLVFFYKLSPFWVAADSVKIEINVLSLSHFTGYRLLAVKRTDYLIWKKERRKPKKGKGEEILFKDCHQFGALKRKNACDPSCSIYKYESRVAKLSGKRLFLVLNDKANTLPGEGLTNILW